MGRRTKDLVKRIRPGEIAVIDHKDLDRVAAESLVDAGVAAVLNASPSISGRYPNRGPLVVVEAGVPLVDFPDEPLFDLVQDGDEILVDGGRVFKEGRLIARGTVLTRDEILQMMDRARDAIGDELERFAVNTLEYIEKEAKSFFRPLALPPLETQIRGRHCLVVVRGHDYRHDLRALKPYIAEYRPVLIAVDGGADALLEMRLRPDVIIGDFDSLSEDAFACGAELVHHVHPDGRAPGRENLQARGLRPGVDYHEFVVEGTSEDAALLLAHECRAKLIVAVGTHATMVEFLDKGRAGMASTFLTRLRLGPDLVDAKGVSRLYEGRVRRRDLVVMIVAALVVVLSIMAASESMRTFLEGVWLSLRDAWYSLTDRI